MKMIVKRCYVYWRKACQITSGEKVTNLRNPVTGQTLVWCLRIHFDMTGEKLNMQHGILHNLVFNMGFCPFWWRFFLNMLCPNHPFRILWNEGESPRNSQRKPPPTDSPSTVAVPCLSMLKASKNLRKYGAVLPTQGNQSLLFELFVLAGCCWLLFLDFVVVSFLVVGLAILLLYVLLAWWVEASKDAKDWKNPA